MRKTMLAAMLWAAMVSQAVATRYPLVGGQGLVHVQSAKVAPGFGFRSINAISRYSGSNLDGVDTTRDSYIDLWSYNAITYSPIQGLGITLSGLGHGEKWTFQNAAPGQDAILGCPGDVSLSVKYGRALAGGKLNLALMPKVTIPMGKEGTATDGTPLVVDPASQTGKPDAGAKVLADLNLGRATIYANAGYMTRGKQRAQVPFGVAGEYGISAMFSAFMEISGEYRMGTQKDTVHRTWYPKGVGYDRNEMRLSPGVRFVPLEFLAVNLAADIGLSAVTAPWQVVLGIDLPASAGRAAQALILGGIAGIIKDRDNQVPMKGMITFPGSELPGLVSDDMGSYLAKLPPGEYKIHIYANGYRWLERRIKVEPGKTIKWDLTLKRKLGTISGIVVDAATGAPLAATLSFAGSSIPPFSTDPATGAYETQVPPGKYRLSASAPGYQSQEFEHTIRDKAEINQSFALQSLAPALPVAATPSYPQRPPRGSDQPAAPKLPTATTAPRPEPTTRPSSAQPAAPTKMTAEEIENLYKAGVRQFMNEEFKKAEATFQSVLKADPGHAKAKDYLAKTRARLKLIK